MRRTKDTKINIYRPHRFGFERRVIIEAIQVASKRWQEFLWEHCNTRQIAHKRRDDEMDEFTKEHRRNEYCCVTNNASFHFNNRPLTASQNQIDIRQGPDRFNHLTIWSYPCALGIISGLWIVSLLLFLGRSRIFSLLIRLHIFMFFRRQAFVRQIWVG